MYLVIQRDLFRWDLAGDHLEQTLDALLKDTVLTFLLCVAPLPGCNRDESATFWKGLSRAKPTHLQLESWEGVYLGGGFKYFLFSSLFVEMIQFD